MKPDFRRWPRIFPPQSRAVRVLPFLLGAIACTGPLAAQPDVPPVDLTWGARLMTDRLTVSERAFLAQAGESIRQLRRLGELGQSQARESEMRAHAQKIASDNRPLLERIERLARKKGAALLPSPEIPSESYQELAAKSGPEFERAFAGILYELHERALTLFEQAAGDARDPDVRQFAASQLPMLREHRNRMTVLRKQFE